MRLFTLCTYLKTTESYDRWVTRRLCGFRQKISKVKYLKISQNISGKYQEASGEHRDTVQNGCSLIRVDAIRWSGYVRPEKLKRLLSHSASGARCKISGCKGGSSRIPDVKMLAHEILPRVDWAMLHKGDCLCVQGVGTPLPDDMECARLSGYIVRMENID